MLSTLNLKIIIGVLSFIIGSAFYYNSIKGEMEALRSQNSELQLITQINDKTIKELKIQQTRANVEIVRLNDKLAISRLNRRLLENKLAEHNLGELTVKKPTLIENIINDATKDSMRCFELLSGSPLTEEEKGATSATQFNSECPYLFDSIPN